MGSPPSIARIMKAYARSPPTKSLSAPKDVGTLKNDKQTGKDIKSSNPKANSVPPPRAVLSSPDNDGMIGSRNKLNFARSAVASKRLRPTSSEQIKPAGVGQARIKVELGGNTTQGSPNFRKLRPKTENCGLAGGRTRKDPLKPIVQRQKTNTIGDRTSS